MNRNEMKTAIIFAGLKGCDVSCIDETGAVHWTQGLPAGKYPARQFLPLVPSSCSLMLEGAVTAVIPNLGRIARMPYGKGSHDSGANPDFVVTSAARYERELQLTMQRLTKKTDALDRKLAQAEALARQRHETLEVERSAPVDVIDDEDDGEPVEETTIDE